MRDDSNILTGVGVVIIGRNEGDRLIRCLKSLVAQSKQLVYVDSGSTDGSVSMARCMDIEVVELDMTIPFCAARARNAGYEHLMRHNSEVMFIQFIDGDCEIISGWLQSASSALEQRSEWAIVAGWLHERFPEVSIYNRLGDMEWNFARVGEINSVGGIFMIRRKAFDSVGGFNPTIAAGEEPELCQRLINKGWRIQRLDRDMAYHDLAIVRFSQWWKRMTRFGYGSVDVSERFDLTYFRRNNFRVRLWTIWLVATGITGSLVVIGVLNGTGILFVLMLFSLWPAQLCRIAFRTWHIKKQKLGLATAYAFFMMISLWPQMGGQLLFYADRLRNRTSRLIEYKTPIGSDFDSSHGAGDQFGTTRER